MEPSTSEDPQAAILFFSVSLVIGIVCKKLLHGTKVPYTVAVFLLGIVLGYIEYGTNVGLGKLGISIRMWANINPDLILFVFLPPLLFESAFSMEAHQVKRCLAQMVLLAGPGVLISTFLIGTMIHFLFPFGWNWTTSFLLGGLLSATDPVAVVAFLKELGASKKLSTLIEGESIMNDGVSIVVFRIFFEMVLGQTLNVPKSIKYLSQVSFGAIALGLLFGLLPFVWLGFTRNDIVTELTLTFAVSYIAYFSAEDGVHVSGIITVTALGILFSSLVKLSFKGERQQIMHNFWETISYVADTLVFILSGTIIAESIHQSQIYIQAGGSETVQVIIQESEAEGESAKQYLEDVQLTFPQVLSAVKIKQVTCSTLLELIHYVQDLEKVGLLNEIEMNELQNAVEADLQKLGRNPPSIKMPQLNDILANQPLLRNLPSTVGEPLGSSAKVVMKPRGSILYNQSSEPEGLWLIANGVVKCYCTDFADRHVPNPTFTCGSTLGLYEALTGKPHLCVLTAESAVHCFFIERKKILSSIESAPETEELFWKESALVVAKLLSPQQFQGFSVEQLWDSLFEQSTMHILLRDEVIETRPLDVILVLEGFVKQMGRMTSVEAPAILTTNAEHHEITLDQLEARFQAMTRSRIIIFHFNSFQQ